MRGTMLWFNEADEVGLITAETGERLAVQREDFVDRKSPKGRCAGKPVEFRVREDVEGRKAEQVVLVPDVVARRARRRRGVSR